MTTADATSLMGGARLEMAHDLIAKKTLLGKTRAEVVGLLGPTTTENLPEWDLDYWLGPNGIDDWWLVLRFDDNGRMTESRIVRY